MRKYLITQLFLFACQTIIHAQNLERITILENRKKIDSLRIEALKQRMQVVKDTARINCLNEIAVTFLNHARMSAQKSADSAFFYSTLASREALQTGYKYGEAQALVIIANSKWLIQDTKECEIYVKRASQLAVELNADLLIGKSYIQLGRLENPLENYRKAVYHLKNTGNTKLETEATLRLCMAEIEKGQYETGFPYCEKCIELASSNVKKDTSDEWGHEMVAWSYLNMYDLYKAAGDYETALEYLQKANKYAEDKNLSGWISYGSISELYNNLGKQDSALFYWNLWKKDWNSYVEGHRIYGNNVLAQIYLKKNQPDSALSILENSLSLHWKKSKLNEYDEWSLLNTLFLKAEAYLQKNDYNRALSNARKAVERFEYYDSRPRMMDGYQLLSSVYYHLGRHKDAYETLVKYQTIKDSIQSRQFLIRLNNYKKEAEDAKKESRIGFLQRDNQIKQQQLKQEATFRNFLIAVFAAFVFAGLYVYRNVSLKRKNERLQQEQKEQGWRMKQFESEKKQVELQKQAVELEMQALRAQMNPHFIFNCLSSINRFILKNDGKTASNYLTRFSRLIRMVLINSQKPIISLEEELQMLRLYLDMERLRFRNSFDYVISFTNEMDTEIVQIPPLILQPVCENALWHGLMHKPGQGHLSIELSMMDNVLQCVITDDGIGREKAAELNTLTAEKGKSLGLRITAERLALISRNSGLNTDYEITDLKDEDGNAAGTNVTLKISCKESIENPA
jgi:tetratricopeptide (TPR) repeat protein